MISADIIRKKLSFSSDMSKLHFPLEHRLLLITKRAIANSILSLKFNQRNVIAAIASTSSHV